MQRGSHETCRREMRRSLDHDRSLLRVSACQSAALACQWSGVDHPAIVAGLGSNTPGPSANQSLTMIGLEPVAPGRVLSIAMSMKHPLKPRSTGSSTVG